MRNIIKSVICIILCLGLVAAFAACNGEKPEGDADIYYMEYNGVRIELGAKADSVLKALGEARSTKELGDCGGLGAQVKYSYTDIDVYTLKTDDGETVDQISFANDIPKTSKNICLGASVDAVIEAYGEPTEKNDGDMRYIDGDMVLKFKTDNGAVKAIEYIRITK